MNAVPKPTGPRPVDGHTSDQRFKNTTTFPCGEQTVQSEYSYSRDDVNPRVFPRGIAVAAISEMAAAAPHMDFSVAMARAMLDDAVREERELVARRRHGAGGAP